MCEVAGDCLRDNIVGWRDGLLGYPDDDTTTGFDLLLKYDFLQEHECKLGMLYKFTDRFWKLVADWARSQYSLSAIFEEAEKS
jgi:hypothetical protein